MKKSVLKSLGILAAAVLAGGVQTLTAEAETPYTGWYEEYGAKYWYENGVRQGTTGRGKEIYDPASDAWYWLDANENGRMAVSKDVYQESNGGKWVRYDANGHMVKGETYSNGAWYRFDEITGAMIKGWYTAPAADGSLSTYYYDLTTGKMTKGEAVIDGVHCVFDVNTGIGLDGRWYETGGGRYWYEGGRRQGTTGRGKEIYDPASNAWYWLDANAQGRMAVSKDVYQESNGGKWVRYDKDGHMVKGHNYYNGSWYCFDQVTGAMIKGWYSETVSGGTVNTYYYDKNTGKRVQGVAVIDGVPCAFDDSTGIALDKKWRTINGANYWYEGGKRQGMEGRGKEIYDAASDAWYWLDGTAQGAMAVNRDIYQDAGGGKWVRYDQYGHMVKGWSEKDGKTYYFDLNTGAMVHGTVTIDGIEYHFNKDTGVLESSQGNVPLNYTWDPVKYTYKQPNGSVDRFVTREYDDRGRVINETTAGGDGRLKERTTSAYDNYGNLLRRAFYDERGARSRYFEYTYDAGGRQTRASYTDVKDSSKSYTATFSYNNAGKPTEKITYNAAGAKTGREVSFYDTSGRMLQKSIYTVNNNTEVYSNYYTYKYDGAGNITEESYYRCTGTGTSAREYLVYRDTYTYDSAGNRKRYEEYDQNNNRKQYTDYTYYTYLGKTFEKMVTAYKNDGSVLWRYEYEWNGATPIKYTRYKEKMAMDYYTLYDTASYPTDRNVTSHTTTDYTYNGNGTLKEIVETEYRLNSYEN